MERSFSVLHFCFDNAKKFIKDNKMCSNKLTKYLLSALFLSFLMLPEVVFGQYFGKNKVQYEDFNFQVLHTDHFDIYHYPQEKKAISDFARLSERWYSRHSSMLNHDIQFQNPLILYANHADFQQNDVVPRVSVGTGGVTEGRRNRVVMPFAEANASTNHVLGHELVHAFQYDIARQDKVGGIQATSKLPLWFIEGMAEYMSVGPTSTQTAMYLRDAVYYDDIPSIEDLSSGSDYFPYRYGHSLWAYITGRWGDETVHDLYVASAQKGIKLGFAEVLKFSVDSVSTMWQNSIKEKYRDDVVNATPPDSVGKIIRGKSINKGRINVGPAMSPDGEYVAFISEKNLFSIELFLADAETGKIIRKLTSTTTSPHLNALRFIESSGSWSPDGERLAVAVFSKGDNKLAIIDVSEGGIKRQIGFGKVSALTNPAWSPDGNKIAFSGSRGGYSDLYIYNIKKDSLRNITRDRYSDMQPTWSPDGSKIAFATDRGKDTSFETMTFGNMKIAEYSLKSERTRLLPQFHNSKHINPKYGSDGNSLYYISNYEGFANVYRYDFETGERYQVTDVLTGVSGISEFSPALSIAENTGDMMVSVFKKSNYSLYRIPEEQTDGEQLINYAQKVYSDRLPPLNASGNQRMQNYLDDPVYGLPADTAFTLSDYNPTLTLSSVSGGGGIGVGYGGNRMGVGAAGGVTFGFSDMLNQHRLFANVQLQGKLRDIGGQVGYVNTDNRITYGGSISHRTYRTTRAGVTDTTIVRDGQQYEGVQLNRITQRTFQDRLSLLGYYPLSTTQRFETSANYTRIGYNFELEQSLIVGNSLLNRSRQELATPSPLNLVSTSFAYVSDNSISAFTGPIKGHRMRFEVEPTTGSLSYMTAVADYRRYFYARPVTFAFRGMHTARYLGDSESDRLTPNFIGQETLVRGYNSSSFSSGECTRAVGGGCAEFERLIGSKVGVANFEVRFPILGAESLALFETRMFPTTLSPFFDAGVAWTANDLPELKWETRSPERIPVFSSGVSLRVNVLGYLVTELYYAFPFQRPETTGTFGLSISPGW